MLAVLCHCSCCLAATWPASLLLLLPCSSPLYQFTTPVMGFSTTSSSSSSSLTDSLSAPIRSFFASLDDPAIPWKTLVLYLVLAVYSFETYLSLRQYKVYSYAAPPASLARHVDLDTFKKSQLYGRDKARFGFVVGAWGLINSLAVIHFDLLPLVWTWSGMLLQKMGRTPSEVSRLV